MEDGRFTSRILTRDLTFHQFKLYEKPFEKIGITGTRKGMSPWQRMTFAVIFHSLKNPIELHHGGCVGVDKQISEFVNEYYKHVKIIEHLPKKPEAKYYIARNHDIVNACDIIISLPKESTEVIRSGTWATIRYAKEKRKPLEIIWPDGGTTCFV